MTDARRVRRHEAGHLLASRLLGQADPTHVHTLSDGSGECGAASKPPDIAPGVMTRAEWHWYVTAHAVAYLSGEAALEAFGYADPAVGAGWDRGLASKAAEAMDPAHVDLWMARFYRVALALCRDHLAALDRLSDTLARNDDRLYGAEVTTALDAALAGAPSPIFTGRRHISQEVFVDRLSVANREREAANAERTV